MMKQCNKCEEIKPLEDFHKSTRTPDGHNTMCKKCRHRRRNNSRSLPMPIAMKPKTIEEKMMVRRLQACEGL